MTAERPPGAGASGLDPEPAPDEEAPAPGLPAPRPPDDEPASRPEPGPEPESGPGPDPEPEPPDPFAGVSASPSRIPGQALDLLTRSAADLRTASFYIGLLVLVGAGPFVLLTWRIVQVAPGITATALGRRDLLASGLFGYFDLTAYVALAAVVIAFIESRAVATTLLGARMAGGRLPLPAAVERSRRVFWWLLAGLVIVGVPTLLAQEVLEGWLAGPFGAGNEFSVLTAALLASIVTTPFVFLTSGVVLGAMGPIHAARQSVSRFRKAVRAAVVVSVFAFASQFLTVLGISAAIEVVARIAMFMASLGIGGLVGDALTSAALIGLVFAFGSLLFTVVAISLAPQVVAWLALTRRAPGLETVWAGPDQPPRFRWLTRPYRVLAGAAVLGLLAGHGILSGFVPA